MRLFHCEVKDFHVAVFRQCRWLSVVRVEFGVRCGVRWSSGSDQAMSPISQKNHSGSTCFQTPYRPFWPQNGPDRSPLALGVQILPLSPLLFAPRLVSRGRFSSCRQILGSLQRYSRSTWPLERCPHSSVLRNGDGITSLSRRRDLGQICSISKGVNQRCCSHHAAINSSVR